MQVVVRYKPIATISYKATGLKIRLHRWAPNEDLEARNASIIYFRKETNIDEPLRANQRAIR